MKGCQSETRHALEGGGGGEWGKSLSQKLLNGFGRWYGDGVMISWSGVGVSSERNQPTLLTMLCGDVTASCPAVCRFSNWLFISIVRLRSEWGVEILIMFLLPPSSSQKKRICFGAPSFSSMLHKRLFEVSRDKSLIWHQFHKGRAWTVNQTQASQTWQTVTDRILSLVKTSSELIQNRLSWLSPEVWRFLWFQELTLSS